MIGDAFVRANAAARARPGRFRTIGVVTFNLTAVGNIRILDAVISEAQSHGYSVNVAVVDTPTEHDIRAAVRAMTDRAVDGIVVIEARVLDTPNLQLPQEVPAVIADSSASHDHPTFGMDEATGARAARPSARAGSPHRSPPCWPYRLNPAERSRRVASDASARGRPCQRSTETGHPTGYCGGLELLEDQTSQRSSRRTTRWPPGCSVPPPTGLVCPRGSQRCGNDDQDFAPYQTPP